MSPAYENQDFELANIIMGDSVRLFVNRLNNAMSLTILRL